MGPMFGCVWLWEAVADHSPLTLPMFFFSFLLPDLGGTSVLMNANYEMSGA